MERSSKDKKLERDPFQKGLSQSDFTLKENTENSINKNNTDIEDLFSRRGPKNKSSVENSVPEILNYSKKADPVEDLKFAEEDSGYKAVVIQKPGYIDQIKILKVSSEDVGEEEVQILVKAFSLNFGDLLCVKGLYPTMPDYPFTPGFEVSGEVVKVGSKVTGIKPGDEVIGLMGFKLGGHSTIVNAHESLVVKKPNNISYEEACAFPVVYVTVRNVFEKAAVKPGEKILIQTAAGGTGLIAVQFALRAGAEVYATAGSAQKLDYLSKMGVKHLINYREENFEERIMELTHNYGVDIVINTLSGDAIQKGLNILAPGGRYIEIAMTALKSSAKLDLSFLVDNQSFFSVDLRKLISKQPELVRYYLEDMSTALEEGTIKPTVGKVFSFDRVKEAYSYLEDRSNIGKIVVATGAKKAFMHTENINSSFGEKSSDGGEVAVVGIACRYAGANNYREFWSNIKNGIGTVTEVPEDRWDHEVYFDTDRTKMDKTYCKWGGFLREIDLFDPLFFNMSGKEAEMTDPQQRVLLEECWNALEDAGYANETLSNKRCGVFMGVGPGDYQALMKEIGVLQNAQSFLGNSSSVSAARISYFLNLKGPSIAIDTACSSSLVAIHQACRSIAAGDCEMALAGGVFIACTPDFFIMSSNANMLSPDGKAYTFDNRANGFVPGEGAGVIVLKSLKRALEDGDNIYGVIKGTGINQDGKTNGITAPSTLSQTELELDVYRRADISPETLGYIEAHGTGTKLGDPIEVEALTNAFRKYTNKKQFCAIGSVKTNIGHTVMAAGVAGVIKVLLGLRHSLIPPSLNYETENEHINFQDSPFYVNTQLKSWERNNRTPRRAAVSSFGFSGTNAHLVIEDIPEGKNIDSPIKPYYLIVLSAKTEKALELKVEDLLRWIDDEGKSVDIVNAGYTLGIGRSHFLYRCAFVVKDMQELRGTLIALRQGERPEGVYFGNSNEANNNISLTDNGLVEKICRTVSNEAEYLKNLLSLAQLYVKGFIPDWKKLFGEATRVSMPTYPFIKNRFWFQSNECKKGSINSLYPLIDRVDTAKSIEIKGIAFEKQFLKGDRIIKDHIVGGIAILPAAAYIEMVLEAASEMNKGQLFRVSKVAFLNPMIFGEETVSVKLLIKIICEGKWSFQIESGNGQVIFSKGEITAVKESAIFNHSVLKLDDLKLQCGESLSIDNFYKGFEDSGIEYGFFYKVVKEIRTDGNTAISFIETSNFSSGSEGYIIHPAILDGAFQTIAPLAMGQNFSKGKTMVPFMSGRVEVLSPIGARAWVYASKGEAGKVNIALMDENGSVGVKVYDIELREYTKSNTIQSKRSFYYYPTWNVFKMPLVQQKRKCEGKVLVFYCPQGQELCDTVIKVLHQCEVVKIKLEQKGNGDCGNEYIVDPGDSDKLGEIISESKQISEVYFIAVSMEQKSDELEMLNQAQKNGVLCLLQIIKALYKYGWESKRINIKVVTNNAFELVDGDGIFPYYSALYGFVGSLAKENPNWSAGCIDIDMQNNDIVNSIEESGKLITRDEWMNSGETVSLRSGVLYKRVLKEVELNASEMVPYKKNGVYFIIGGTGGIGRVLSLHLADKFSARLVLVGRKELNDNIKSFIEEIKSNGGEGIYIKADATDEYSMRTALSEAKMHYGNVNGVIHSAIVLNDKLIKNITLNEFESTLDTKSKSSVILNKIFKEEELDFMMFFSSAQSFSKSPGQANYSAACTFKDSFARFTGRTSSYPVKIVNWGYWGETGIVSGEKYKKSITGKGVIPISNKEGIDAINRILTSSFEQVVAMKAEKAILEMMGIDGCSTAKDIVSLGTNEPDINIDRAVGSVKLAKNASTIMAGMGAIEKLGVDMLVNALSQIGLWGDISEKHDIENLISRLGIIEQYKRLFKAILDILGRQNLLDIQDGTVTFVKKPHIKTWSQLEMEKTELAAAHPEVKAHVELLYACLKVYPEVLKGQKSHMEVMFKDGSSSLVEGIYKGNAASDYYNNLVAEIVKSYVEQNKILGKKLNILEIGAGTGGTSKFVLEALKENKDYIVYHYTDISASFTKYGREVYGIDYDFMEYKVLNIEESIKKQGFNTGEMDLVFASNVIHATGNIKATLENIKQLLKPGGILVVNELTHPSDFATLTFGLTEGWWLYQDPEVRFGSSPLLSADTWRIMLTSSGYRNVQVHGFPSFRESGQCVFVSRSNGVISYEVVKKHENKPVSYSEINKTASIQPVKTALKPVSVVHTDLKDAVVNYIKEVFSRILRIDKHEIDTSSTFEKYGVDSLITVEINKQLSDDFGESSSTLLFEYNTVEALAGYIMKKYKNKVESKFGIKEPTSLGEVNTLFDKLTDVGECISDEVISVIEDGGLEEGNCEPALKRPSDIAIIGIYGRYPMAEDFDELWENLKNGRNCITEIPEDRWNWRDFFSNNYKDKGKSYSRWGGFIKNIDCFDTLFFQISPKEAEGMDPQERLFLECVWKLFEDAGMTKREFDELERKVGVFAGVMNSDYTRFGPNPSYWSVANRVSYFFNFQGPSLTLDTACSSSLTAVHLACESIRNGECRVAVAGGVNLIIHPSHYSNLTGMNMLAKDDKCKAFGEGADGFIDGEGVGAVLLKPLEDAIKDGNRIYAVIKGTYINSGGKTSGFTVPNPNAQAEVIEEAINRAKINPRTISYIEAHGTGTALGDPIEIAGLTKAFSCFTDDKQFCPVGTVKSNIGHLESAAGIASITKVILQMLHKTLVPSINADRLNDKINFKDSPFYVQRELKEWEQPEITIDSKIVRCPRRAGISSFGAGGSNAHIIIEEFDDNRVYRNPHYGDKFVFVLSAKTKDRLLAYSQEMLKFILSRQVIQKGHCSTTDCKKLFCRDLIEIVAEAMEVNERELDMEESFRGYGFDLFQLSRVRDDINEKFNVLLSTEELIQAPSIGRLVEYVFSNCSSKIEDYYRNIGINAAGSVKESSTSLSPGLLAYNLQVGREAMDERIAIVYGNMEELAEKLALYIKGNRNVDGLYTGSVKDGKLAVSLMTGGREGQEFIRIIINEKKLEKLASLWVSGMDIEWSQLYDGERLERISLPTYPFEKRRCWIENIPQESDYKLSRTIEGPLAFEPEILYSSSGRREFGFMEGIDEEIKNFRCNEVHLEMVDKEIALVIMQDRKNRNMFSNNIVKGLMSAFWRISQDETIKAVVLTGYDNIFSMGGTFEELLSIADQTGGFKDVAFIYKGLLECKVPVISAIQGHAVGGGLTFGMYADITVMAKEGVYSANFMKYGFTPGLGSTYILRDRFGSSLASEMMFTAKEYSGEELMKRGASFIFKNGPEVLNEALRIAKSMADKPQNALKLLKTELSGRILSVLPYIIERESKMHDISFSNPQVKERINFYSHISKAEAKEAMNNESQRWDRMEQRPVLADKTIIEGKERASVKLTSGMSLEYIQNQVIEVVKNILRYKDNEISTELSFSELGADSISGVEIIRDINTRFGTHLEAAEIYNHPNIKKLSAYIQEVTGNGYMLQINRSLPEKDIEITNTEHNYMEIVTDCYSNAFAEENHLSKAPEKVFTETEIKEKIVNVIKNILHLTENEIVSDKGFNEMGVDSISSVEIIRDINREYGLSLEAVTLYNYPNINLLAAYILSQLSSLTVSEKPGSGFNKPDNKREKTLELLRMLQDGILDINDVDRLTEEV